jgi:hypothetical protein
VQDSRSLARFFLFLKVVFEVLIPDSSQNQSPSELSKTRIKSQQNVLIQSQYSRTTSRFA